MNAILPAEVMFPGQDPDLRPWLFLRDRFYQEHPDHEGPIPLSWFTEHDREWYPGFSWKVFGNDELKEPKPKPRSIRCCQCGDAREGYGVDHNGKVRAYCTLCLDICAKRPIVLRIVL